jgi:hypothetical protein
VGIGALKSLLLQLLVLFFRQEETTDVGEMIWKFLGILPNFEILHEILVMWLYAYVLLFVNIDARVYIYRNIYIELKISKNNKQNTTSSCLNLETAFT